MTAALLTPEEAARRIRVSTKTLRQFRREGLIRYVALTERKILYRPEDCDAFVDARSRVDQPHHPVPRKSRGTRKRREDTNVVSFTARRQARLEGRAADGTAR